MTKVNGGEEVVFSSDAAVSTDEYVVLCDSCMHGRWVVVRDILVVVHDGAKNNIDQRTCWDGPSCTMYKCLNLTTLTCSTTSYYIQ